MKKSLLALSIIVLSLVFATGSFAQTTTRGGGGASGIPAVTPSFTVPAGPNLTLNFDQPTATSIPTLTSVTYNGVTTVLNGNPFQLFSCLNFTQCFQVFSTCAAHQHPAGCHSTTCYNPNCHQ